MPAGMSSSHVSKSNAASPIRIHGGTRRTAGIFLDTVAPPGGSSSLKAEDPVDALHSDNDDRLPGNEVTNPVEQGSVEDVRSLPSAAKLRNDDAHSDIPNNYYW